VELYYGYESDAVVLRIVAFNSSSSVCHIKPQVGGCSRFRLLVVVVVVCGGGVDDENINQEQQQHQQQFDTKYI
jgi:hypothetical protein